MNEQGALPQHIAIIMDGNGRWAEKRKGLRSLGHKAGVDAVRDVIDYADDLGIEAITVFAFGQENWQRPLSEVNFLMNLFLTSLKKQIKALHERNIVLRIIGDRSRLQSKLVQAVNEAEALTVNNTGLKFTVALSYSGRWDLLQAFKQLQAAIANDQLQLSDINETTLAAYLQTHGLPEPDLLIRSGGEYRLSNFMLWQLAYTELYFTDTYWPDFNRDTLQLALKQYQQRQRRFGLTGAQVAEQHLDDAKYG